VCLIIDANVVSSVFPAPSPDFLPVHRALIAGKARLVYGGKLTQEYAAVKSFRRLLLLLDQRGSARQVSDVAVNAEANRLLALDLCRSDDQHIVALARVSGVRLLCSNDKDLSDDFKNVTLISHPTGSVYRRAAHAHLLRKHCP
jgi:hypothetical protein